MATTVKKFDKRYLSIFIDRLIPSWFKSQYPKYRLFIKHWLEYLEQDDNAWENASNFIKFMDIDQIDALENTELRELIINQIYKMFLGSEDARYLSTLMDEILFLKQQKTILKQKGRKSVFLLMLLYILNGYFRIENITTMNKRHNGFFQHNGLLNYTNYEGYIQPYLYLIISEFNIADYEEIAKELNPSGMLYIAVVSKNYLTSSGALHNPNIEKYAEDINIIIS